MKVLLTGANGLLGQKLVPLLAEDPEIELIATGRGACRLPDEQSTFIYEPMDITNKKEIEKVFSRYKPEAVIHTAAMTHVDKCEQNRELCHKINVEALGDLLETARQYECYFQFLSTDFIFDGENGPYDENDQATPVNYYGETKLEGERLVQNSGLKHSIIRTVLVYGLAHDMSRSNIILWVKDSLENQKPIKVVNDQWRTPTLAEDLAQGCYLAVKKQAEGIFNICGKDFLNPYEMAVMTAEFFKLDTASMTEADSSIFSQPAQRPPKTGLRIEKAVNTLGYRPHSFMEGITLLSEQLKRK